MNELQIIWFWLILFLLTVYAVLDGFDLGAGIFSLFVTKDEHKSSILSAIGPFWDGNEVWLLTGGGAIFAAFPHVYATVFSGFYLALMFLLFALIFRGVSIEFRNKHDSPSWHSVWDIGFGLGSFIPSLLFGVAMGNILRGIPLSEGMEFEGTFLGLLNPYSILVGILSVTMFAMHGGAYLCKRTGGELALKAAHFTKYAAILSLVFFIETTLTSYHWFPRLFDNFRRVPLLWMLPLLVFASIVATIFYRSFISSTISVTALMIMAGVALFPNIVPASGDPALNLTIANASSSLLTLKVMLVIALLGMPPVIGYTAWIYYTFRR